MKFFKDTDDNVFAFDEDGSQDKYISSDLVAISKGEADKLVEKAQEMSRAETEDYIPDTLSRFQMLSILKISKLDSGESMYQVVDNFINKLSDDSPDNIIIKTAWDSASEFRRESLLVSAIQKHLNLSAAEIDDLFKNGAQLST